MSPGRLVAFVAQDAPGGAIVGAAGRAFDGNSTAAPQTAQLRALARITLRRRHPSGAPSGHTPRGPSIVLGNPSRVLSHVPVAGGLLAASAGAYDSRPLVAS